MSQQSAISFYIPGFSWGSCPLSSCDKSMSSNHTPLMRLGFDHKPVFILNTLPVQNAFLNPTQNKFLNESNGVSSAHHGHGHWFCHAQAWIGGKWVHQLPGYTYYLLCCSVEVWSMRIFTCPGTQRILFMQALPHIHPWPGKLSIGSVLPDSTEIIHFKNSLPLEQDPLGYSCWGCWTWFSTRRWGTGMGLWGMTMPLAKANNKYDVENDPWRTIRFLFSVLELIQNNNRDT